MPPFDAATYHEPAVAVRSGEILRVPPAGIPPELVDLIDAMLAADPARRPSISRVHSTLMGLRPAAPPVEPAAASGTLRGKGLRTALRGSGPTTSGPSGGLVGKLVQKLTDRSGR
jgi:hypothetical protein